MLHESPDVSQMCPDTVKLIVVSGSTAAQSDHITLFCICVAIITTGPCDFCWFCCFFNMFSGVFGSETSGGARGYLPEQLDLLGSLIRSSVYSLLLIKAYINQLQPRYRMTIDIYIVQG